MTLSLPFTLTNGQTADATQVMADFNAIVSYINGGGLATSGANLNITSLGGLTTPLSIPQGGTGSTTGAGACAAIGALQVANNLSDVASFQSARTNILPSQAGANGKVLTSNGTDVAWQTPAAAQIPITYAQFQEQQASGTGSSTSLTANAWTKRTLNTTVVNTIVGCSIASSQITLPAGTYILIEKGGFTGVGSAGFARTRIRNVTDSTTIAGGFAVDAAGVGVPTPNDVQAMFVLGATKVIEIDTFITSATSGLGGTALTTGDPEVYTDVMIQKIA